MIIDLLLAAYVGIDSRSFTAFLVLAVLGFLFCRADKPFSSGLLRLCLLLGVSALFSLFGDSDLDA